MRQILEDLRNIHQGEAEVKEEYRTLFNEAIFHCGNFHSEDENIALHIDGLLDTIRTVVARYRESVHRMELTFEAFAHFLKSEDEAYRARSRYLMRSKAELNTTCKPCSPLP